MSSIDRQPHALKREKTMTIPRHFVFFDTETDPVHLPEGNIRQDFKLGWACYYRRPYGRHKERIEWFYFDTVVAFWDFVFTRTQPKQRLWIIARNIVFDFTVCKGWQHLKSEGYKLKFFHNNGVCVIVTVRKGNKSIVFLDSMNWFPESLKATGERIGIKKMDIDFETCTIEELSVYCRNDVLIEFENIRLFIKFLQGNNISRMCYTRASTAMAAYLLRHYHTPIYIHNNAEAINLERASYKGGRCECFFIGDLNHEAYYVLDVNSLYPFCMAKNPYPTKYKQLVHKMRVKECRELLKTHSITAKVRIKTDEPVYAIKEGRTIFPIGKFDATLSTPELRYALAHNHILRIYDAVVYEQANIFESYVTTIYALRQDFKSAGVRAYEQLCKYLLNSLYGKFGQKAENWEKIGDAPNEPDREELIFYTEPRKIMRIRYLLGCVYELKSHTESYNSFPAISAHVTAFGRMYLWYLMKLAGHGNYFYCDTDSLIVNEQGLNSLAGAIEPTELGKLKLEETLSHLTIRGLKDYETDSKTVIKGIRKNALQIAKNTYTQESWPSFKGLLKGKDINTYTVKTVTKHLTRNYTKGTVESSGRVNPFVLV